MTANYTNEVSLFLTQHGVRPGSHITAQLSDGAIWTGQIAEAPGDSQSPWLYLRCHEHCIGLDIRQIQQLTEVEYQPVDTPPQPPPRWQLAPQKEPLSGARFAPKAAGARVLRDTVYIIECGQSMAACTIAPGPSSNWQEALHNQWQGSAPLAYVTLHLTPQEIDPEQTWQGLYQHIVEAIERQARGVVVLCPPDHTLALSQRMALLFRSLPCPILFWGQSAQRPTSMGASKDALRAALYAARYIDVGEVMLCLQDTGETTNLPGAEPWFQLPSSHQDRAPKGSYHFVRATAAPSNIHKMPFVSTKASLIGSIHRHRLVLQTLYASPLRPLESRARQPLSRSFHKEIRGLALASEAALDWSLAAQSKGLVVTCEGGLIATGDLAHIKALCDRQLPIVFASSINHSTQLSMAQSHQLRAWGIPSIAATASFACLKLAWALAQTTDRAQVCALMQSKHDWPYP